MTDQNKDQKPRNQGPTAKTLTEKVRQIQERARQMRVALTVGMARHSWTRRGAKTAKETAQG